MSALWEILLDLSYCDGFIDISALGSVYNLNLSHCDRITDVSALGTVHTLNLSHCSGISDVSALGTVYDLDLSDTKIVDVSALNAVLKLKFTSSAY